MTDVTYPVEEKCMVCGKPGRVKGRILCLECNTLSERLPRYKMCQEPKPQAPKPVSVEGFAYSEGRWLSREEFPSSIRQYVTGQAGPGGPLVSQRVGARIKYIHRKFHNSSSNSWDLRRCNMLSTDNELVIHNLIADSIGGRAGRLMENFTLDAIKIYLKLRWKPLSFKEGMKTYCGIYPTAILHTSVRCIKILTWLN